ncbi:hypothetical protein FAM09_23315 [Niastella caeni]|uniref:Uncharacterized protein n=1 Tax=Niastella caeni TaxID=2569763 RepID=A0A4S8HMA5_9BACT|nr:hypothetical protein [Niastella caeni]THU34924.1 hypothetical protein FAM09_23315 [Niastella caeni]
MTYTAPAIHARISMFQFFIYIDIGTAYRFNGPLLYKTPADTEYNSVPFPYKGSLFNAGMGYYLKHFFLNKGSYSLSLGVEYSRLFVRDISVSRLADIDNNGQSLVVRKYEGNGGEIRPAINLDRYCWIMNKQFAFQLSYSYPVHRFTIDNVSNYERNYYFYTSGGHSLTLRLGYNFAPSVKYNPTKMAKL